MAVEAKRGCGFRKVGGLYLVSGEVGEPCHRLPFPLHVCPTCHGGIKPSRGWTWVGTDLFRPRCMVVGNPDHCARCVVCSPDRIDEIAQAQDPPEAGRFGLLWVGGGFYPSAEAFLEEAARLGVSRRIAAIPRGFKVGETFVLLAHQSALAGQSCAHENRDGQGIEFAPGECPHGCTENKAARPGIFRVFRPQRIELILRQSEATTERIAEEAKRGVTVVAVPDGDPDHDPKGAPAEDNGAES